MAKAEQSCLTPAFDRRAVAIRKNHTLTEERGVSIGVKAGSASHFVSLVRLGCLSARSDHQPKEHNTKPPHSVQMTCRKVDTL